MKAQNTMKERNGELNKKNQTQLLGMKSTVTNT